MQPAETISVRARSVSDVRCGCPRRIAVDERTGGSPARPAAQCEPNMELPRPRCHSLPMKQIHLLVHRWRVYGRQGRRALNAIGRSGTVVLGVPLHGRTWLRRPARPGTDRVAMLRGGAGAGAALSVAGSVAPGRPWHCGGRRGQLVCYCVASRAGASRCRCDTSRLLPSLDCGDGSCSDFATARKAGVPQVLD